MPKVNAAMVKKLRDKTGAGMMDCKNALQECEGNFEKSFDFLRKKGISIALKRSDKIASEGVIGSYIHVGGKIGVMVEINCETDFVAKTNDFKEFAKNIAMHIAAANPITILSEDISDDIILREKEIYKAQALKTGKSDAILNKIVNSKIQKFLKENCLINQQYVKDVDKTISDYLNEIISKTGEKISIRRFCRFQIGGA